MLLDSVTSDLQAVTATVVGDSTINIQCQFIHGSDAVGCKVVLVSKCPTVQDEHVKILKSDGSNLANHILKLTSNIKFLVITECLPMTLMLMKLLATSLLREK